MPAKEAIKATLIGGGGGALLTSLLQSVRRELIRGESVEKLLFAERQAAIVVLWHGRLLLPAFHYRRENLATLISQNRDGDYITPVVRRWGYRVIRGSSSRGGSAALREIVRAVSEGSTVALTPDGPRGPRQKMKLGPIQAARLAGVPIVPAAGAAVRARYFGRWDRFLVPAPFTWCPIALGDPIPVPRESGGGDLSDIATLVEDRLNELTAFVDEAARARRR